LQSVFLCVFVFSSIGRNVAPIKQKEYKMNTKIPADLIGYINSFPCIQELNGTIRRMIDEDYLTDSGKDLKTGVFDFRFENDNFVLELEVES